MTFHILQAPSALPQFPFLPALFFRALLRHPQPEGCRDWGAAPPSPGGLEHPSHSACSQQLPKAKHQQPTGWLGAAVLFFKDLENQQEGKHQLLGTSFPLALRGRAAHLHTPQESKKKELAPFRINPGRWHHTHPAAGGSSSSFSPSTPPSASVPPCPQLPWLPLLLREAEVVQLARRGSGQAV